MASRITLLTDYGYRDGFAGAMKGVILSRSAAATIVDLSHEVPAGDLRHASCVIGAVAPYYPAGTIHVVVVDPTVGTDRLAVAIVCDDQVYVGPDNGVFTEILANAINPVAVTALDNSAFHCQPVSSTFHGRDVFASCAGYMAAGVPVGAMGSPVDPATLVRLPEPLVDVESGLARGEILTSDHFGNLISSLRAAHLAALGDNVKVTVGSTVIAGLSQAFADVPAGQPLAYLGSAGRLEIAVNRGSAAEALGLVPGTEVLVERA
ncbi:MAG: SAM-dependent chlorinase/fluorinase [Armatimonadetes bacterium]|nr:SAM-dependent chlorinase/fluorinase [Armatimonadota bacterium]